MKKSLIFLAMLLASSIASSVQASDFVLGIFGNANMDNTIDEQDTAYIEGVISGTNEATNLSDANYDGRIDKNDIAQVRLIIKGDDRKITFIDAQTNAITVNKPINRIVTLPPSSLDTIRAIGAAEKIVGISTFLDEVYFPDLSKLPSVGSSWFTPDYEAIIQLDPDIVLTLGNYNQGIENSMGPANITVVRMEFNVVELIPAETKKLGYILGKQKEANEFVNWYMGKIDEIQSKTEGLSENEKPLVFMGYQNMVAGKGTFWDSACQVAGGINIAGSFDGYREVDPEWLVEQNPSTIVKALTLLTVNEASQGYKTDNTSEMSSARDELLRQDGWKNIDAVKAGNVYVVAWQLQLGTHTIVPTAYLAKWLHPDLFKDLDPQAIHQEYLTRFQHLDFDLDKHGVFVYPPLK
ncbi:MAG: Cobalamin-binding protein precursor [Methanosaeta sp. PtaU1.Bin112]|nr:MAG: Cobalamin-binding protein precursor [Methanosaeta sp. PtaU1.Bin112]